MPYFPNANVTNAISDLRNFFGVVNNGVPEVVAAITQLNQVFSTMLTGGAIKDGFTQLDKNFIDLTSRVSSTTAALTSANSALNTIATQSSKNQLMRTGAGTFVSQGTYNASLSSQGLPYNAQLAQYGTQMTNPAILEEIRRGRTLTGIATKRIFGNDPGSSTGTGVGSILKAPIGNIAGMSGELVTLVRTYNGLDVAVVGAGAAQQQFANKLELSLVAIQKYRTSVRETQVPLRQYAASLNKTATYSDMPGFLKSGTAGIGGEGGLNALESYIQKYGYSLNNLRNIQKEASSGISRLNFQKTVTVGSGADSKDFTENLTVGMDKLGNVLHDTQNRFRSFASSVGRDLGEFLKWTIAASLVYLPLQKVNEAITAMIANQTKLAEVQIVTGQTTKQVFETFTQLASVASATGEHLNDTAGSFADAYVAAGNITNQYERTATAVNLLTDALNLSKLSGLTEAESMDILSAGLKQLGMSLNQGNILLDKWVAVSKVANVDISTLATSFAIVSSAADDVGLKIDKLNGVIAAVAEVSNLSAQETGNMVRAFIAGIQSDQAVKELGKYGIAVRDASGNVRDFMTILTELESKGPLGTQTISEPAMAHVFNVLGGGARRGAQFSAFGSNLGRVQQVADISAADSGDSAKALQARMDTVDTATIRLSNAFSLFAQTLGVKGGLLDGMSQTLNIVNGLLGGITSLASLLGRLAPVVMLAGTAMLVLKNNSAMNTNFKSWMSQAAYDVGYNIGTSPLIQRVKPAQTGKDSAEVPSQQWYVANKKAEQTTDMLNGTITPLVDLPAQGERMGRKFVDTIKKDPFALVVGAQIGLTAIQQIGSGDWASGVGTIMGAGVGAGLMKNSPSIGMLLGSSIAQIFVTALTTSPKAVEGFYELFMKATGRKPGDTTAPIQSDYAKRKSELEGNLKTAAGNLGLDKELGLPAFRNVTVGLVKLMGQLSGSTGDLTDTQLDFASSMIRASDKEKAAFYAAQKALDEFGKTQGQVGRDFSLTSTKAEFSLEKTYASSMDKFIQEYKQQTMDNLSYGKITSNQYSSTMQALPALPTSVSSVADAMGEGYKTAFNNITDVNEAYVKLADTIIKLTPEEQLNIVALAGELNAMIDNGTSGTQDFIDKQKELTAVIHASSVAQEFTSFVAPTRIDKPYSEVDIATITKFGLQSRDQFFSSFKASDETKKIMLNNLEDIAVPVADEAGADAGVAYYKSFAKFGQEWFSAGEKIAKQKNALADTSTLTTVEMTDVSESDLMSKILPRAQQIYAKLKAQGAPLNEEALGVYLKDQKFDKLVANSYALKLAQDETNALLQKQLDGQYNLPEGASFYVPYQTAKMSRGSELANPNTDDILSKIQNGDNLRKFNNADNASMISASIQDTTALIQNGDNLRKFKNADNASMLSDTLQNHAISRNPTSFLENLASGAVAAGASISKIPDININPAPINITVNSNVIAQIDGFRFLNYIKTNLLHTTAQFDASGNGVGGGRGNAYLSN